jgi:CheY-like chemotaxis protein
VVVAEDDTEMRALLAKVLSRDGYEIVEVRDGAEMLRYLEGLAGSGPGGALPDLIVSDIRMPGRTGLDLVAAMHDAHIELPVILITAFSDSATQQQAAALSATLLDKPLDLGELRRVVRDKLAS